jgi:hypothetical protein
MDSAGQGFKCPEEPRYQQTPNRPSFEILINECFPNEDTDGDSSNQLGTQKDIHRSHRSPPVQYEMLVQMPTETSL